MKEPSRYLPFLPDFCSFSFFHFSSFLDFWQIFRCQGWHSAPLDPPSCYATGYIQACSQGGAGVRCTTPNLPKGPLLPTEWGKNGVFVGGLRGVRFKKSTFWVQRVNLFWIRTPLKSILATGLVMYT